MYGIPITPLGHLAHAVFPLLLIAALLRLYGARSNASEPWSTRIDMGLAVGSGAAATGISHGWMAHYFVSRYPLTASDFGQYCESIGVFRDGFLQGWVKQRSVVAGSLPALFADSLGVVDGLLVSAWISHFVMGVGLFLWARAAHSRLAGMMAVLLSCALAPLVHLTRTVTFYPETVAGCVLTAAGAMLAMRYRSLPAFLFSSVAMGLVLLLDVRGLLWALPALGLTLVAVMLARGWFRKLVGLVIVVACLAGSHTIGGKTFWEETPSLEQQTVYYVDEAIRRFSPNDPEAGLATEQDYAESHFVWGRDGLKTIPQTLQFLWTLKQNLPDGIEDQQETAYGRRVHVSPWVFPAFVGLCLGVIGAFRRRWLAAGFVGTVFPFAVALEGTAQMVGHSRYMANGITMVPVLLGVGFAVVYLGCLSEEDEVRLRPWFTKTDGIGLVLVLVALLGIVPTWLSPVANWRAPVSADIEPSSSLWHSANSSDLPLDISPRCASALQRDFADGFPVGSRLMGWEVDESPTHNPTYERE